MFWRGRRNSAADGERLKGAGVVKEIHQVHERDREIVGRGVFTGSEERTEVIVALIADEYNRNCWRSG